MTGPEHYREASNIILDERCDYGCPHAGCQHEMAYLARAIVHAIQANTVAAIDFGTANAKARLEWSNVTDD